MISIRVGVEDRYKLNINIYNKIYKSLNMGASLVYLDKPNKEIEFEQGENDRLKYVAGSMQGWRINMVSPITYTLQYIDDTLLVFNQ